MPSIAPHPSPPRPPSPGAPQLPPIKLDKFRTVIGGLGLPSFGLSDSDHSNPATPPGSLGRHSIRPGSGSHISTNGGRDVTDPSFFGGGGTDDEADGISVRKGVNGKDAGVVKLITSEDGVWSVSVAEAPQDAGAYTIYVKTPTHHLTLTRSVHEVRDLEPKLTTSLPSHPLPPSPFLLSAPTSPTSPSPPSLPPSVPQPRKRSFLTTVTRLVSPSRAAAPYRSARPHTTFFGAARVPHPPDAPDPTSLASWLTKLSNDPRVRTAKAWKRFVRVRVDDLESRRVERRVRRTRSDLAAHQGGKPGKLNTAMSGGSATVGVSGSKTAPVHVGGRGLREMAEESEGEREAEEAARQDSLMDSGMGEEKVEEKAKAEGPVVVDGVSAPEHQAHPTEGMSTAPSDTMPSPEPVPVAAADGPAPALSPPATPKLTPSTAPHADPIPTLHPRPASADPGHSRVWKPSPLNPHPRPELVHRTSSLAGETEEERGSESVATGVEGEEGERKGKKKGKGRKVRIEDFEMMRVLGKGCAGKVLLVRHRASAQLYALKAITKRHVLAHQELQHTLTEQAVLKRMAAEARDPFVVKLWWSFHDRENLFLVMDFHPGGDLATQLARWGRLGRDRARFYAAEIVEGVEGLHTAGVIYRDLKPENILIGADGHIVLTDFGLSKEFPRKTPLPSGGKPLDMYASAPGTPRSTSPFDASAGLWAAAAAVGGRKDRDVTSTFCGTAEYLAPEVIQGLPYSYEVDWWSFGTMLYEMLTGITPFWANNHAEMYVRVLQDELCFPDDKAMDADTKSLIRGLLQRNPALRIAEPRIKRHPYFQMIDWQHVYYKRYIPPYIPPIDPSNESDTQNFDDTFLDMAPIISDDDERADGDRTDTGETETDSVATANGMSRSIDSGIEESAEEDEPDLFDGYSFKGRQSVIIDGVEEEEEEESTSGLRTNTDDSKFSAASAMTQSTAPTSLEDEAVTAPSAAAKPEAEAEKAVDDGAATEPVLTESPTQATMPADVVPAEPEIYPVDGPSEDLAPKPEPSSAELPPPVQEALAAPAAKHPHTRRVEIAEPSPTTPIKPQTKPRNRTRLKEKSGVPALDRDITPAANELERDDDDWDMVENVEFEEANGKGTTSLFARGVVDRYRLAILRRPNSGRSSRTPSNTVFNPDTSDTLSGTASPTPSEGKIRRGRAGGLSIRKSTGQFLRPKSPVSTVSASNSVATRSSLASSAAAISNSTISRMTPPSSFHMTSPTLKTGTSRESVGSPASSDPSLDGDALSLTQSPAGRGSSEKSIPSSQRPTSPQLQEKHKNLKKMKKITEQGAEKVLSLFHAQHQR